MHQQLSPQQYKRLQLAKERKKYGHLATWHELYVFQSTIASPQQIQEIAAFARRKNKGEKITLPLSDFMAEQLAVKSDIDK